MAGVAQPSFAATHVVHAGGDLQAALNSAQPGDDIRLDPGATFSGNFVLPVFAGTDYVTVETDLPSTSEPGASQRITPATAATFAKIVSPNNASAIQTAPGAHHWRLAFLELPNNRDGYGDIIELGDGSSAQTQLSQVPYELVLDHLYIHGDPLVGQKRGVSLNSGTTTIRDCYISDIKAVGADTQAIGGWNGPGPYSIENDYLEAAGEAFLLGGADPSIPNLVSSDVGIRYNYFSRPLAWRQGIIPTPVNATGADASGGSLPAGSYSYVVLARREVGQGTVGHSLPTAAINVSSSSGAAAITWTAVPNASDYQVFGRGQVWTVTSSGFTDTGAAGQTGTAPTDATLWQVKNLLELKNAQRVQIQYNLFENNWLAAQPGYAIVLTPRNQDGHCDWCTVASVDFSHNVVRNTSAGVNILGHDSPLPSGQANGIHITDNLFYGVSTSLGGNGWAIQAGDGPANVVIDHNTIDFDGTTLFYAYGGTAASPTPVPGFQFTNNVSPSGLYGINGAGASTGTLTIQMFLPGSTITGNWISGGPASRYPSGNRFDTPFSAFFVNRAGNDYRLTGALAAPGADGRPAGANLTPLTSLLTSAVQGVMTAPPQAPQNLHIIRGG